jgi:hypothetical protein
MADVTQGSSERPQMAVQHVDLPELAETFSDSIEAVHFDGQTLRLTFAVTRYDQPQTSPPSARRYPACRLVLTSGAGLELMNQMQKLKAGLIKAGVLKADP